MVAQHHALGRTFTENPNKPHVCQDAACSPRICLMRQMGGGNSADLLILSVFFCSSCPQLSPCSTRLGCREQISPYPRTSLLGQPQGWCCCYPRPDLPHSTASAGLVLKWSFTEECSSFCGNTAILCTSCTGWKTSPALQAAGNTAVLCDQYAPELSAAPLNKLKASKITSIKPSPQTLLKPKHGFLFL